MMHPFKLLLAATVVAGVAALPTISRAETSKTDAKGAKSASVSGDKKSQSGVDEFEENRRAHMQKSKENNANKGAN